MNPLFLLLVVLTGCFHTIQPRERVAELPEAGAFPHALMDEVQGRFVDERGRVDFAGLQQDRGALDRYVATVAKVSPESHPELFPTEAHALAYWINAYNALAMVGVLERPGLQSVNDIKVEFFYGTRYPVGGRRLDLYRMENGVVRKQFDEPRIHFALNCQSGGCPTLPQHAFHPETLDAELATVTKRFVTNPEKVRLADDGAVEMSEIFKWYAEDFEALGGPVAAANQWGASLPAGAEVRWIPYDWSLIAQPGRGP